MEENEFKKLTANSRDWLIYQLLYCKSKETVEKEIRGEKVRSAAHTEVQRLPCGNDETDLRNAHDSKPPNPKGETTVQETVTGKVVIVTEKAVLIGVADRVAWFPKSVIENLDKIVLDKDKQAELIIKDWFKYKIEWKVPQE